MEFIDIKEQMPPEGKNLVVLSKRYRDSWTILIGSFNRHQGWYFENLDPRENDQLVCYWMLLDDAELPNIYDYKC